MLAVEFVSLLLILAASAVAYFWYDAYQRRMCLERLDGPRVIVDTSMQPHASRRDRFPPRYYWVPAVIVIASATLFFVLGVPMPFVAAAGGIIGVMGFVAESFAAAKKTIDIEVQLADAIDVMVGSLRAGSTLVAALDAALREARPPLEPYLADVVSRIRLGAKPDVAVQSLAERVPLEEFRLFSLTIAAQWWVGGSVASTLSRVGRTIRDRVELSRRIRSQRIEAEFSVYGVLAISYVVALIVWRTNPEPTVQFLRSSVGIEMTAGAVVMQAIGLAWIAKLSHIRF